MLDIWAREGGAKDFAALDRERQAALKERLKRDLRTIRYDAKLDTITVSNVRARAMGVTGAHYAALFSTDPALEELRVQYAIPKRSLIDTEQRRQLGAFFFWIAWTSVTERPGEAITYTNNWPHEPLVGITPSASLGMWSIASVLFLLAGIGWLLWYQRPGRRGACRCSCG